MIAAAKMASGFLLTLCIFALLGPAVGAFAGAILIFGVDAARNGFSPKILEAFTAMLGIGILFAFFAGVKLALLAGAIVAAAGILLRRNSLAIAAAAGVAACLFYWISEYSRPAQLANVFALSFLPICILASLACWYVTRGIVRWTWTERALADKPVA